MLCILAILQEHYSNIIDSTDTSTLNHLALHIATGWARKRYKARLTTETLQEVQQLFETPPTTPSTSWSEDYLIERQPTLRQISTETQTTPTHTAAKVSFTLLLESPRFTDIATTNPQAYSGLRHRPPNQEPVSHLHYPIKPTQAYDIDLPTRSLCLTFITPYQGLQPTKGQLPTP
ncbi:hypothetical protein INR49_019282, partial [Caranx melampygus]